MATARHVIKAAREEQGLSIRRLARLADVDHTYLARYEKGETANEPSPRWLRSVAQALGKNLVELDRTAS